MAQNFWSGWDSQEAQNQQRSLAGLQRATGVMGILSKMQEQQERNKVKEILASSPDEDTALARLPKEGGVLGIEVAKHISALKKQKMEGAQQAREAAVFSPQSIAELTTGGRPAIPARPEAEVMPPDVAGPPAPAIEAQPAVPGKLDVDALRLKAAMTGPKGFEAYSAHLEGEKNRQLQIAAMIQNVRERLAADMQRAKERGEDQKAIARMQIEARKEIAAMLAENRQPRNLQLTVDAEGNQLIVNPDGTTSPLTTQTGEGVKKPVLADKPMTEFQGKAALYGTRAAQSDKVLKELEDNISTAGLSAAQTMGVAGNILMSSEQRRVNQAQRDFVNAVLRQESGAVISDAEFENAKKQYFVTPGDDENTINQKRANRKLAIKGFARMSGPKGAVEIQSIIDNPLLPGQAPQRRKEDILKRADEIVKGNK